MVRLGIIGGGGVGAAHAIAARRLGWDIGFVVDNNPEVLQRYQDEVLYNSWGPIEEQAQLNEDIHVAATVRQLDVSCNDVSHVLIATPHTLHLEHYRAMLDHCIHWPKRPSILIEKPGLVFEGHQYDYVAYKSLLEPNIAKRLQHGRIKRLAMLHDYPPTHRQFPDNILWDVGSHLMAMVWRASGDVIDQASLKLHTLTDWSVSFHANDILCFAAYNFREHTGIDVLESVIGGNDLDLAEARKNSHVLIDDQFFPASDDIFDQQLWMWEHQQLPVSVDEAAIIEMALLNLQMQQVNPVK